ncbi:unnamed protein product [Rhizophagus irregularis]|nr:unnamed protein product [Rhizophagus irregularis]
MYGPHYTSNFEIFDLHGLIRLVSPRTHFSYENPTFDNQACITEFRVNKIANFIYEHKMRDHLDHSINYIRTLPKSTNYNQRLHELADIAENAVKKWKEYEDNSTSSEKRKYLSNTRSLSIMILTAYVLDAETAIKNKQSPFLEVIDIDVRGRVMCQYSDPITNINVEIGEIKKLVEKML